MNLATLIRQKRETFLTGDERDKMLNTLKAAAETALGDDHEISDGTLNQLLLEDKNILEATKAHKVGKENDDKAAVAATGHNLLMLLGKARCDLADDDNDHVIVMIDSDDND